MLLCAEKGLLGMTQTIFSVAAQSGTPGNQPQRKQRTDRVEECVFPEYVSCRGCSHSYRPDLSDGGCKLHFEAAARQEKGGAC